MPRFFIQLSYKGTAYSGFQVQKNSLTVQSAVESAFATIHRKEISLTGSSRTDAGVHALMNFFHFDADAIHPQFIYKMNAVLPHDIAIQAVYVMDEGRHCRFDARGRYYQYRLHRQKDPFLKEFSYYYPYRLNLELLREAADILKSQTNFEGFSKTNSQVKNFNCLIRRSEWTETGGGLVYHIEANRFLRGMVRLITGTLLRVGREQLGMEEFKLMLKMGEKAGFSVPAHGLYLVEVNYPENYFPA